MTSLFEQSTLHYGRRQLSDSLIGPVLSHVSASRHAGTTSIPTYQNESARWYQPIDPPLVSSPPSEDTTRTPLSPSTNNVSVTASPANTVQFRSEQAKTKPIGPVSSPKAFPAKRKYGKTSYKTSQHRLEQCRANQIRYRKKQKDYQDQLEKSVDRLRGEVDELKQRRQKIASLEMNDQSPWNVVADVFRLMETSFRSPWCMENDEDTENEAKMKKVLTMLQNSFTHDVSMGNLSGVDALLRQLRCYSRYFSKPKIQLKKIEEEAPGVVLATAQLRLTVSEYSLRYVFPHLLKTSRSKYDTQLSIAERLLGKQLSTSCSMRFFFNCASGRVVRVETNIDWMTPLLGLLETLEDVGQVLNNSLISCECVISSTGR